MAITNSSRTQTLILMIALLSFLLSTQNANSASFSFPNFGPYTQKIALQGGAFFSNDTIRLTGAFLPYSTGRASYNAPLRLWDSKSDKLVWFTTVFSFVVAPNTPKGLLGDGIAFFIAPFDSNIPQNSSGGYLGLFSADTALNNTYKNQLVAVEFDSYGREFGGNPWDPVFPHVGIDVNSIASVVTSQWETGSVDNGFVAFARVEYEPETKNLSVVVSYPGSGYGSLSSAWTLIDLRYVLPEWVRVGFSGATGELVELHKILSWSFSSSF